MNSLILPTFPYLPTTITLPNTTTTVAHPRRPIKPTGRLAQSDPIYSRFNPTLNEYFKLEPVTLADLPTIHGWLNDERVDVFWQEKGTIEAHQKFLEERFNDPHGGLR